MATQEASWSWLEERVFSNQDVYAARESTALWGMLSGHVNTIQTDGSEGLMDSLKGQQPTSCWQLEVSRSWNI